MTEETVNLPPDPSPLIRLLADIRFASGDGGKRMQDELVEYIRELRADAERYHWLKRRAFCNVWARGDGIALVVPRGCAGDADAMIDINMEAKP